MTQMVDRVDLVRNRCVHLCAWRAKVVLLPKLGGNACYAVRLNIGKRGKWKLSSL